MKTITIIIALLLATAAVAGGVVAVNNMNNDTATTDSTQNNTTSDDNQSSDDTSSDDPSSSDSSSGDSGSSDSSSSGGSSSGGSSGSGGSSSSSGSSSGGSSSGGSSSSDSSSTSTTVTSISGLTITYNAGTECHTITTNGSEYTITFTGATVDTECEISGTLNGNIVIDIDDTLEFKLSLNGVTIKSSLEAPIVATSADKLMISAKKSTTNYVYDNRSEITDDSLISSAIYATCDMDVQGKGTLYVYSENNNGIHSKDDLDVKNLTLTVVCQDNALKGNDSVTITSGTISLTAEYGDGIKTSNNELKTKDDGTTVQKGKVIINTDDGDLTLTIKAMFDGIDAVYSAEFDETSGTLTVNITTGSYAGYTYTSTTTSSNASSTTTNAMMGGSPGGWMPDGNPDGWDDRDDSDSPSMKGIKGDVYILISGGTFTISSEDDAVHSDGYITIEGGDLTIKSGDDGVHADGAVTITGGTIYVAECYEGIEGDTISVSSGDIVVISSDDGFNSTGTSGVGISISGGTILIRSGGDGVDSNSLTQYKGFVMSGGDVSIVSNGASDSAIDTEAGYTFTGGRLIGICQSGGMSGECTYCSNFSSIGKSSTASLSSGKYVTVTVGGETVTALKITSSINAFIVYLGSSSATISTTSSFSGADSNGVYWS